MIENHLAHVLSQLHKFQIVYDTYADLIIKEHALTGHNNHIIWKLDPKIKVTRLETLLMAEYLFRSHSPVGSICVNLHRRLGNNSNLSFRVLIDRKSNMMIHTRTDNLALELFKPVQGTNLSTLAFNPRYFKDDKSRIWHLDAGHMLDLDGFMPNEPVEMQILYDNLVSKLAP